MDSGDLQFDADERLPLVAGYIRHLANRMGLTDCRLCVTADDGDSENHATVECTRGRNVAVICLGAEFWKDSQEGQRDTIVHELLHIVTRRVKDAPDSLKESVGRVVYETWVDRFDEEIEYAVDQLTRVIAPSMPTRLATQTLMARIMDGK